MELASAVDQLGLTTPQHHTLPRPNIPRTPTTRRVVRRPATHREYRIPASLMHLIEQGMPLTALATGGNSSGPAACSSGIAAAAPVPTPLPAALPPSPILVPTPPPTIAPPTVPPPTPASEAAAGNPCFARCYECGSPTHKFYDCPRLDRSRIRRGSVCKPWREARGRRGGGRGGGRGSRGAPASKPEEKGHGGQTIIYNFQHHFN